MEDGPAASLSSDALDLSMLDDFGMVDSPPGIIPTVTEARTGGAYRSPPPDRARARVRSKNKPLFPHAPYAHTGTINALPLQLGGPAISPAPPPSHQVSSF